MFGISPESEYEVAVEPAFTGGDHEEPPSVERSILYPVIAEPPLFAGAVQLRLICDDDAAVAVSPVGDPGAVAVLPVIEDFTSIATSSQKSPPLAVQLQVTEPAVVCTVELDAPVTALGMLTSQLCVQVGLESVTPPYIEGESKTQLFVYFVVIDTVGLLEAVLWFVILVGIGVVWSTPEKEYAPTITDVEPAIVTIMFPVPAGFVIYQNSASLLAKEDVAIVSCTPPNVTEATLLLFASTPTTSKRLLPVPTLKLESVIWYGDDDTVPDVVCIPFKTMELDVVSLLVVADAVLDGELVPTELIAETR